MTRLTAERLRAGYGWRTVLDGVDLEFVAPTLTAVVGPNGSGKSTLLRCFAGLLHPTAGSTRLDGIDVSSLGRAEVARRVALVPQTYEAVFPFSVREIVALGRVARLGRLGVPRAADDAAIERAMSDLDVLDLAARPFDELSGGERQRVVLAMALAQEADVLLLDEPTVHLDPAHQRATVDLVRSLARARGLVAIAVLHDLNLAAALCDRVVVLAAGRVVADGKPLDALAVTTVHDVFGAGLVVGSRDGVPFVLPAG